MTRTFRTAVVALAMTGFAATLPLAAAEALPFYHKECTTHWRHHKKVTVCKRVVFRKHPVRKTVKEFLN